jgi:hypothetical protein
MTKNKFNNIKRQLLKIYPEANRFFEVLEGKIGQEFEYREASIVIFRKMFMSPGEFKNIPLI